jgi:putative ABC transport system permease protein
MLLNHLVQDLRIGCRVLLKERGFCALAVGVLALGICAVTTQFTVVNAMVLRGFSFAHPEQLVDIAIGDPVLLPQGVTEVSAPDYLDMRTQQHSYSALAAYIQGATVNATINGSPKRYQGTYVTEDFFRILGVTPQVGRDFLAADNRAGAERAIIISDKLWRRDFGGIPDVIGKTLRLNGKMATVVGVMPARFEFPANEELWVPLFAEFAVRPRGDRTASTVTVMGRLKPGVSLDAANAEMNAIARRLALENPKTNKVVTAGQVQPLLNNFVGSHFRNLLFGMLAAVAVVLLIACVNVMNMQFARATLRAKELAIRGALGATRGRLVAQMLTESFLIAAAGAGVGILMSEWALVFLTRALSSLSFPLPYWVEFTLDPKVLAFTVAVTSVAALLSGLLPAMIVSRANAAAVMKEAGRGNSSRLINVLTRGLVIAQIALSSALLVACCFQVKNVMRQQSLDYGYNETAVMTGRMAMFEGDYPTAASRVQFLTQALRRLRTDPEIEAAALSTRLRMAFDGFGPYEVTGKAYVDEHDRPLCSVESVSDGYFDALGIRILEGRGFNEDDTDAKQPVAIVNASFARKHYGRESALGRQVRLFRPGSVQLWRTIVGVVPDTRMQGPFPDNGAIIDEGFFVPLNGPDTPLFSTLIIRPRGGVTTNAANLLRRDLAAIDPNLPLYFVGTPAQLHRELLGQTRVVASLFAIFGAVAILLSAVGLYGVMSFSVNQRTTEFGIRMALGAGQSDILSIVLQQGGVQLVAGLSLGMGLAVTLLLLAGASTLGNFLPFVSPRDPIVYGLVAAVTTAVALVSCLVPATRATRVDPMVALRPD